jgi:hypothetical protein
VNPTGAAGAQIGNAYHNQLELPVLFCVVLLAFQTQTLDVVLLVLSWMFVLSRLVTPMSM